MNDRRRNRETEESRTTRSLAGLAMVLALIVVGLFLTQKLTGMARMEDCLMSGRTNCDLLEDGEVQ